MRKSQGYSQIDGPGLRGLSDPGLNALHRNKECDTYTCAHCGCLVFVKPLADPADMGGLCKVCMGLICSACVDLRACTPFEAKLERQLTRAWRLREYG